MCIQGKESGAFCIWKDENDGWLYISRLVCVCARRPIYWSYSYARYETFCRAGVFVYERTGKGREILDGWMEIRKEGVGYHFGFMDVLKL